MSVLASPLNEKGQSAFQEAKERLGSSDPGKQVLILLDKIEKLERQVVDLYFEMAQDDAEEMEEKSQVTNAEEVKEGEVVVKRRGRPKKQVS